MTYPIYATFGETNQGYSLISFDGDISVLPKQLSGLTDTPPGSISRNDEWWPAIGCSPLEDWFVIWWTIPDFNSHRYGTVSSQVALWPLSEIGAVNDISNILMKLGNLTNIPQISNEAIEFVIDALIQQRNPILLTNLNDWGAQLNKLWSLLWPEARKSLSTRVALTPQNNGLSSRVSIYCVPQTHLNSWADDSFNIVVASQVSSSRGSRYITDKNDATVESIFKQNILNTSHLYELKRIFRAADQLDQFNHDPTPRSAIDLLRDLCAIEPSNGFLDEVKVRAVKALNDSVKIMDINSILSLRNLNDEQQPFTLPQDELKHWFLKHLPTIQLADAKRILSSLTASSAKSWWQAALITAFKESLNNSLYDWKSIQLECVVDVELYVLLNPYIPDSLEDILIQAYQLNQPQGSLSNIINVSAARNWSSLHALALKDTYDVHEAFEKQLLLSNPLKGLELLINLLPGNEVVDEIISRRDSRLLDLLSFRTIKEPDLMNRLNALNLSWLQLWEFHILYGGQRWPSTREQNEVCIELFEYIVADGTVVPDQLIQTLAVDIASNAEQYDKRALLWKNLNGNAKESLLQAVAEIVLRQCAIKEYQTQEPELIIKVIGLARNKSYLNIRTILNLLLWKNNQISESTALHWLKNLDWGIHAQQLGEVVVQNRWDKIAKDIYRRFKHGERSLKLAVDASKNLLSSKDKFFLKYLDLTHLTVKYSSPSPADSISMLADFGVELQPERLTAIWEKAGGELKYLKPNLRPDDAWHEAARLAQNGSLKNGLVALVDQLIKESPNNNDLLEFRNCLH